ncbi:MAG: type secretion system inner rane protein [Gemmatimonadetes bacterium]|nr:type secretion system inner rane protein [Gemmatimonadota bacterium]
MMLAEVPAQLDPFAKGSVTVLALLGLRITGLVLIAPVFSAKPIPQHLKAGLIVLFAILLQPAAHASAVGVPVLNMATGFSETMVGFAIGLGAALLVGACDAAGELMAIQIGLSGAAILDPMTSQQGPALGQFTNFFAVALMLALDAHIVMIDAIAASTRVIPVGSSLDLANGARAMVGIGSQLFVLGLRFAAPVIAVVLIANVALAILSRAAPQLNILSVAFPIQIGVGLTAFAATIPVIGMFFNGWTTFYQGVLTQSLGALSATGLR